MRLLLRVPPVKRTRTLKIRLQKRGSTLDLKVLDTFITLSFTTTYLLSKIKTNYYYYFPSCLNHFTHFNNFKSPDLWLLDQTNQMKLDLKTGMSTRHSLRLLDCLGPNKLQVQIPNMFFAFFQETLQPFYLYTLLACTVWIYDSYIFYAVMIIFFAVLSGVVTVYGDRQNLLNIKKSINIVIPINVYRDGQWKTVVSTSIYPGDVVELKDGDTVAADLVLITGECIIDESSITGEAVPVRKFPLQLPSSQWNAENIKIESLKKRHALYMGTSILKAVPKRTSQDNALISGFHENKVTAIVKATGFSTQKGDLIRTILHPAPIIFKFDRHVTYFLFCMVFYALIAFVVDIIFWGEAKTGLVNGFEVVSIIIPVVIPFVMSASLIYAVIHLKTRDIHCIAPRRVIIAGSTQLLCFDKTGTLTKQGLSLDSAQITHFAERQNSIDANQSSDGLDENDENEYYQGNTSLYEDKIRIADLDGISLEKRLIGCCHSIGVVSETGELIGNPLDITMFKTCGYELAETMDGNYSKNSQVGVKMKYLKINDFDHTVARMSVLVKTIYTGYDSTDYSGSSSSPPSRQKETFDVFCKGGVESIIGCCRPESIPDQDQLDEKVKFYSKQGGYLIAMAWKRIQLPVEQGYDTENNSSSNDQEKNFANSLERSECERDLHFLGFMIFQNQIKDEAPSVIEQLKRGYIRSIIVTGDNPYTAVAIARDCGIIPRSQSVYISQFKAKSSHNPPSSNNDEDDDSADPISQIEWVNYDTNDTIEFNQLSFTDYLHHENPKDQMLPYELVVTGPVYTHLSTVAFSSSSPSSSSSSYTFSKTEYHNLLLSTRIFARTTPHHKTSLLSILSNEPVGLTTMFCGDGSNDSGALRSASSSLFLSPSSTPSPLATFSSPALSQLPYILSLSRSTIHSATQTLKALLIIYPILQVLSSLGSAFYRHEMTQAQYIFQDLALVLPLQSLLTNPNPHPTLTHSPPLSCGLLNPLFVISYLSHSIIFFFGFGMGLFIFGGRDGGEGMIGVGWILSSLGMIFISIACSVPNKDSKGPRWILGVAVLMMLTVLMVVWFWPGDSGRYFWGLNGVKGGIGEQIGVVVIGISIGCLVVAWEAVLMNWEWLRRKLKPKLKILKL